MYQNILAVNPENSCFFPQTLLFPPRKSMPMASPPLKRSSAITPFSDRKPMKPELKTTLRNIKQKRIKYPCEEKIICVTPIKAL